MNSSISVSRSTLFVIVSAIESDLRAAILTFLPDLNAEKLLGPALYESVIRRVTSDQGFAPTDATTEDLLPYVDFADAYTLLNQHAKQLPENVARYIQKITPNLQNLVAVRNRIMHGRPLHFEDFATVCDTASELTASGEHFSMWYDLAPCIHRLETNPEFVLGIEIPQPIRPPEIPNNLPVPDFDETGFLGRQNDVDTLTALCLGPYPVVTIVGEGGIGKTATALKVAYDLLDNRESQFEAIVWTSCKTAQLTATGLQEIETGITSSIGVLQTAAAELGPGTSDVDPMSEVLAYLKQFRILLIIDNLETVLDETVRSFLARMPFGSKVLITSRIGVGAFEHPMKLSPMMEDESVQLLRAVSRRRGVGDLVKTSNAQLKVYCRRMKHNPLYIKWFVSCVQAGQPPEAALATPTEFLDFAMSNVYDYLSKDSRLVLSALVTIPGAKSQAELTYLTELQTGDLQRALQQLLTSNMLDMKSNAVATSYHTTYLIPDLARRYLEVRKPVSQDEHRRFQRLWQKLVAATETSKSERKWNPYSFRAIAARSTTDLVVARYLQSALDAMFRENFSAADSEIANAKAVAPDFFEVHRVEAISFVQKKNFPAARTSFETAIEIQPQSAPLRTWYAGFLMRELHETETALHQLLKAKQIDPFSTEVNRELGTVYMFLGEYEKAEEILLPMLEATNLDPWFEKKTRGLLLNIYRRWAEKCHQRHDAQGTVKAVEAFVVAWHQCPGNLRDQKMLTSLHQLQGTADQAANDVVDGDFRDRIWDAQKKLRACGVRVPSSQVSTATHSHSGVIASINGLPLPTFGFITAEGREQLYFNKAALRNLAEWPIFSAGKRVGYSIGENRLGKCAEDVFLL